MQSLSDTELVCFSFFQYTIQQTALTSALNTKLKCNVCEMGRTSFGVFCHLLCVLKSYI